MEIFAIEYIEDDLEVLELLIGGFPRQIYTRNEYFESFNGYEFLERFRLSKQTVLEVLAEIEHKLVFPYDRNNCVVPINQLLVALRFYATGSHLLRSHIKFPSTGDEIREGQINFYTCARFPKVIGAIDGTHVKIQSPGGNDAEIYRNRKTYFSINVQAVADADLKFLNIVARWPGSTHDSTIFNHSSLKRLFDENSYQDGILIGDSAYNLRNYLLTPLLNPNDNSERLYNEAHIRTRGVVEKMFGVWKRRFPVVAYGCRLKLSTTLTVIVATAILHNIARKAAEEEPPEENINEIDAAIENGNIILPPRENRAIPNNANNIRLQFINYFKTL